MSLRARGRGRPALDELLAAAATAGDTVVVTRLDRLGRSLPHLLRPRRGPDGPRCGVAFAVRADRHDQRDRAPGAALYSGRWPNLSAVSTMSARCPGWRLPGRGAGSGVVPPALTGRRLAHARDLAAGGMPIAEIADTLLVGRSTVYRALRARHRHAGFVEECTPNAWNV